MAHSKLSFPVQAAVDCDLCEGHVKVDWYCLTCPANLCEKCKVVHLSRKAFRKHDVTTRDLHKKHQDQGNLESTGKCLIHIHNDIIMVCVTCGAPVCNECILRTHNEHKFESLHAELERSRDNLSNYIQKLDQEDKNILDQLKKNDEALNMVDGETLETRIEIIKVRDAFISSVKSESDRLIEQLELGMKKNKHEISRSNSKLQSAHSKIQDTMKKAQAKMKGQSSSSIDQFLKESVKSFYTDISKSNLSVPKFASQTQDATRKIGTLQFEDRTVKNVPLALPIPSDVKVIRTLTASIPVTEMRAASSTQVWCSYYSERSLQLYDINGQNIQSLSLNFLVQGFVFNNIGNIIACDLNDCSIKQIIPDGHVSTLCSISPHEPLGICLNHKQQLVVCMEKSLVVYSSDCKRKLQEFTIDQYGEPLFDRSYRVAMNGNTYYCVTDDGDSKVVAIDMEGRLRWTYRSEHEIFTPYNICCDRHMNVIVADTDDNKVHLLDKEGQFIMFITDKVSIQQPRGLVVSDDDTLWIGEDHDSKKVHVIRYIKR